MKSIYLAPLACAAMLFACANAFAQTTPDGDRSARPNDSADSAKHDMQRGSGTHRDFDSFDTNKHGYLVSDDVKGDEWVRKNFRRCNLKHDGHMSREEYANCKE